MIYLRNFDLFFLTHSSNDTSFFRPLNAIQKQAVIANGVQRNEAICPFLAEILLKRADCFVVPPRNDRFIGQIGGLKNSTAQ